MLKLTEEEYRALQIVVLRTEVQKEQYGGSHQFIWKKAGLSRAYFKNEVVRAERMPTPRVVVALRYLMKPYLEGSPIENNDQIDNVYFKLHEMHRKRIEAHESLNISSYDLFANMNCRGIGCDMFPHLYRQSRFTDTARLELYQEIRKDSTNRVVSIGSSWTREVLVQRAGVCRAVRPGLLLV